MRIKVCVAGATGWTGSQVVRQLLKDDRFELVGAVARKAAGSDLGNALGLPSVGLSISATVAQALATPTDVLVDYAGPRAVKAHALAALGLGVRVVIGSSGLMATDYDELRAAAEGRGLGVVAAGNFSITAALAKHFALIAARHVSSWEIIDYAHADKADAPSGTARELAEALREQATNRLALPLADTLGPREARGATIGDTQVHSVRLPSYVVAFETILGLPHERLTIRHDAGAGAEPYVAGTLLAIERVMQVRGLVRGLDTLLFAADAPST